MRLRQSPRAFVPPALDLASRGNEIMDSLSGTRFPPHCWAHTSFLAPNSHDPGAKRSGSRELSCPTLAQGAEQHSGLSHRAWLSLQVLSPCTRLLPLTLRRAGKVSVHPVDTAAPRGQTQLRGTVCGGGSDGTATASTLLRPSLSPICDPMRWNGPGPRPRHSP